MLTKKDRAAIVNRLRECNTGGFYDIYAAVTGEKVPLRTTRNKDFAAISNVILDLCDTSNMVELPLDKDGEVIKLDDTVYSKYGTESIVDRISYHKDRVTIATHTTDEFESDVYYGWELTHKKPVTIESLASDIKRIANQGRVDRKVYEELFRIAWALESLGDSDD